MATIVQTNETSGKIEIKVDLRILQIDGTSKITIELTDNVGNTTVKEITLNADSTSTLKVNPNGGEFKADTLVSTGSYEGKVFVVKKKYSNK